MRGHGMDNLIQGTDGMSEKSETLKLAEVMRDYTEALLKMRRAINKAADHMGVAAYRASDQLQEIYEPESKENHEDK